MTPTKPTYYKSGEFDVIAFCQYHNLDFCTGNIIKYVTRAGRKDPAKTLEDIDKAQEYLNRLRQYHERAKEQNSATNS